MATLDDELGPGRAAQSAIYRAGVSGRMPRIPVRRFGEPSDFSGIAVYLMSTASSYHTADCLLIDGGYTAF